MVSTAVKAKSYGFENDIYVPTVHAERKYEHELTRQIEYYSSEGLVLLCGDFNA